MNKPTYILLLTVLLLTACSIDDNYYRTPHPWQGVVAITTDWNAHSAEAAVPDSYCIKIDETSAPGQQTVNYFPEWQEPGEHFLVAHNEHKNFTVTGNKVRLDLLPDGSLTPTDEHFFSGTQTITVVQDDTLHVTLPMLQRTRRLQLVLNLEGDDGSLLAATHATLKGVAQEMDITTGAITSTEGTDLHPLFVQNGNKLTATMNLFGFVSGEAQKFSITFSMTNGQDYTVENDLTEALRSFSSEKELLSLNASLHLEAQGDYRFEIGKWLPGGEFTEDAN